MPDIQTKDFKVLLDDNKKNASLVSDEARLVKMESLNEARIKLEEIIDNLHDVYHPWDKPRTDRRVALSEYFRWCNTQEHSMKEIRYAMRRQLKHIKHDLDNVEKYLEKGYALPRQYIDPYLQVRKLYIERKQYFAEHFPHRIDG